MTTFNILLAYDTSYYGTVSVEAETWEEAVSSLTDDDWDNECTDPSSDVWEPRVVHVEDEAGDILAEDLAKYAYMTSIESVTHAIQAIIDQHHSGEATTAMTEALELLTKELNDGRQHPLFRKDAAQ